MSAAAVRRGFSVNVFLPTGDPEGLKVVEKSNWTGRGLVIPRAMFGESKSRDELGRTGVYLLVGPSESSSLPSLYVGEGDPIRQRLESHAKSKDFWTHAVAFTSKDSNLNKAHVQRLESRLVELAKAAKRCVLDNGNMPAPPSLSEADEAMAEGFLDDMLLCLPILGYSMFEVGSTTSARDGHTTLYLAAKGIEAKGQETTAGLVVFANSTAVGDDKLVPSVMNRYTYIKDMREELIRQGVMAPHAAGYIFTQDYLFTSPSFAATVLLGRTANGRVEWKAKDGRTLKQLQEAEVDG